jgi:hypothetical protein
VSKYNREGSELSCPVCAFLLRVQPDYQPYTIEDPAFPTFAHTHARKIDTCTLYIGSKMAKENIRGESLRQSPIISRILKHHQRHRSDAHPPPFPELRTEIRSKQEEDLSALELSTSGTTERKLGHKNHERR